jgi:hypothetical protein
VIQQTDIHQFQRLLNTRSDLTICLLGSASRRDGYASARQLLRYT